MAKKLKVGDTLHGYQITQVFGPGMMAISYAARSRTGQKVFFKQYKSPAPTVVWYEAFVAYQKELSARVRAGTAAHFAVRQLDAFEAAWGGRCYFQTYEFVEHGADLQQMLDAERERHRLTKSAPARDPVLWAHHVTWARVLIAAVAALHEAKVVHADLKPANAYLVTDPTISTGAQLKLIDMDFSLLADRRPPWHGHQGYVGTDNYRSPEHLARGAVPGLASDVFTCGLMLYELLAGEHPYWRNDQTDYARLVQAHAARPTAAGLRDLLSGRGARVEATRPAVAAPPSPVAGKPAAPASTRPAGQAIESERLELVVADGQLVQIGVRTELGKALLRQFGPDSEFWDNRQCVLKRNGGRQWVLSPIPGTTTETLLNGKAITAPRVLRQGDRIAVGRQHKGISKMALTARGR